MGKESADFSSWLRDALGSTTRRAVMEASGEKENGRPVIDESRLSRWLSGTQRPSIENAALVARILGKPESEALIAAGYAYGRSLESIERMRAERPGASVGTSTQDEDTLLFRRPDGVTDEEWERIRSDNEDFWQWRLDKASRER